MTMHKALHPRDDVDRQYVSRKDGVRGLASIEDIMWNMKVTIIPTGIGVFGTVTKGLLKKLEDLEVGR